MERRHNHFVVEFVPMDLYKPSDFISHDLLVAKLKADGFDDYLAHFIYTYLGNRKQSVRINNERSNLQNIVSGVHQSSVSRAYFILLVFLTIFL